MQSDQNKIDRNVQRRLTKQRKVILEELCKSDSHPTADELYQTVRQRMPNISLGTVYRNLDFLTEQGQIAKIEYSGSQMRFDALLEFHQHVRCVKCGAISDVFNTVQPPDISSIEVPGFTLLSSRIEFDGICDKCVQEERGSS
jgi:Fe2+/Zn2+ uptake regulation proteins